MREFSKTEENNEKNRKQAILAKELPVFSARVSLGYPKIIFST